MDYLGVFYVRQHLHARKYMHSYKAESLEETIVMFNSNIKKRDASIRLDPYKWHGRAVSCIECGKDNSGEEKSNIQ